MRFPLGNMTSDLQNKVFRAQQDIITELADRESCIIVGRCADYVLREKKNLMRVYYTLAMRTSTTTVSIIWL